MATSGFCRNFNEYEPLYVAQASGLTTWQD
jgi:hypothetical protein